MLAFVNQLPQYWLKVKEASKPRGDGKNPIDIEFTIQCGLLEEYSAKVKSKGKNKFRDGTMVLTTTSDLEFVDFRKISCVTKTLACGSRRSLDLQHQASEGA